MLFKSSLTTNRRNFAAQTFLTEGNLATKGVHITLTLFVMALCLPKLIGVCIPVVIWI